MTELLKELQDYLKENYIKFESGVDGEVQFVEIEGKKYELNEPNEEGRLFDEDFKWDCYYTDLDGYIFKFGGVWYTMNKGEENSPKFKRVKYLGEINIDDYDEYLPGCFLGIHGPFELLNGSGSYKDWAKKARFLKLKKLGLCEKGTLAGIFKFQSACLGEGIDPVFGMEIPIKNESKDLIYTIKMYAKDEIGWQSLLKINKILQVDGNGYCTEEDIVNNRKQTFIILDPKTLAFENIPSLWKMFSQQFYYQFDTVVYEKEDRDKWYLENLKKYAHSKIAPIAITDAYYLDKEYSFIRTLLNKVAGKVNYESNNQYFKNQKEYFEEFEVLFKDDDKMFDLYELAVSNLHYVAEHCHYLIPTDKRHLPKYEMTREERKRYSSNEELFEDLVYEGLERHIELLNEHGDDVVAKRIQEEIDTVHKGGLEDYFLILHSIMKYASENNMVRGVGRGSGAGALINYLLDLTHIDPIKYNLLFSRFLNEGRLFRDEEKEFLLCDSESDKDFIIDPLKTYTVLRKGKKIQILGSELKDGDEIEENQLEEL